MIFVYLLGFLAVFGLMLWFLSIYAAREDTSAAAPVLAIDGLLTRNPDQAVEEMRRWYQSSGQDVMVGVALGNVLRHAAKLDVALRTHKSLVVRSGLTRFQQKMIETEISADHLALNQLDEAAAALARALELGDPDARLARLGEEIYVAQKQWDHAVDLVQDYGKRTGADVSTRIALLHYAQGRALWDAEALAEAHKKFKKATAADSGCLPAWLAIARYHRYNGKPEKGRKLLLKHADTFAAQPWLRMEGLTRIAFALENNDAFLEPAKAHLEDYPDDWRTRAALAAFLIEIDALEEAAAELLTCLKAKPDVLLLHREYMKLLSASPDNRELTKFSDYHQLVDTDRPLESVWACTNCGHPSQVYQWSCPSCHTAYACEAREI